MCGLECVCVCKILQFLLTGERFMGRKNSLDDSSCLMRNTICGFTDLPNFYACTLLLKRIARFVKQ